MLALGPVPHERLRASEQPLLRRELPLVLRRQARPAVGRVRARLRERQACDRLLARRDREPAARCRAIDLDEVVQPRRERLPLLDVRNLAVDTGLAATEAREHLLRGGLRVCEREACERLAQLFGLADARCGAFSREPREAVGVLFERRREQRTPRRERERVREKPRVALEGAGGARVPRRDALIEASRAFGVGQVGDERLDFFL